MPTNDILESIADPVVVYDGDWCVRYENQAASRTFVRGERKHSLIGRVLWTEFPDLAGTAFELEMRRAMETRVPTSFTERRRGSSVWTEVRCYPLVDGGIAVTWRDITDQKRAEQTLRYLSRASDVLGASLDYEQTMGALARLIVPELADWCSISILEGDEIRMVATAHIDPAKVQLVKALDAKYPSSPTGNTRTAEVIRTGKSELIDEITEAMIDRSIQDPEYRAMLKELGFTSVITVPLAVRDRVLGAMSLVAIGAESHRRFTNADMHLASELARRAAIAVDNARLYQEAVEARRSAELANAVKTEFLTRMSHELRTPLNAIGGYADLLLMGIRGEINAEQRSDLERITRNQLHLLSLINDILNYAKVEAGRLEYDIGSVLLADVLRGIEQLFAPQLRERQITYRLGAIDAALCVHADGDKLQQILLNLVSNAVKFTAAGGAIDVSVRSTDEHAEVLVADTGVGIPVEKLEAIFEPFVQVQRAGAMAQGTGLGLAISRDLARGMHGDLHAESGAGGSTFVLRLKRA